MLGGGGRLTKEPEDVPDDDACAMFTAAMASRVCIHVKARHFKYVHANIQASVVVVKLHEVDYLVNKIFRVSKYIKQTAKN